MCAGCASALYAAERTHFFADLQISVEKEMDLQYSYNKKEKALRFLEGAVYGNPKKYLGGCGGNSAHF